MYLICPSLLPVLLYCITYRPGTVVHVRFVLYLLLYCYSVECCRSCSVLYFRCLYLTACDVPYGTTSSGTGLVLIDRQRLCSCQMTGGQAAWLSCSALLGVLGGSWGGSRYGYAYAGGAAWKWPTRVLSHGGVGRCCLALLSLLTVEVFVLAVFMTQVQCGV